MKMLRIKDIQNSMRMLVGFEQSEDPARKIRHYLTKSESGLTYQQANGLLTLDNIRAILSNMTSVSFPQWSASANYKESDIVKYDNKAYICVKDHTAHVPQVADFNAGDYNADYGNGYWREWDQLSEYLRNAVDNGVATMINRFIETKSLNRTSKGLLEHKCLFDGSGRMSNTTQSVGKLVGYEIEPLNGIGVTTQLHRIGLQMVGATGLVRVYLMHSSKPTPVAHYDLRIRSVNTYQWFSIPDTFLNYMSDGASGGSWYICYHQDELPNNMLAVNVNKDFGREPCRQCNLRDAEAWRNLTKYVRVSPFRVEADWDGGDAAMFDEADIEYTPTECYGINLELSVGCDLTDFIIANKYMFASVLQKQVALSLIEKIKYNPNVNVNRNQVNVSRQDINYDTDGSVYSHNDGLRGELDRAYKAIEIDTTGIDKVCLQCSKRGVRYGVA